LLHRLWDQLKKGDILLGDRAYGEYTTLATGPRQGVDVVARLHARRKVDFRKARRLGKNDGLFVWTKGYQQSEILSATQWSLLPAQITVRLVRFTATIRGFRARRITLVTTLLDPADYPAQDLIALYARRWRLELCLRDLKTMMGMEQLRCKSPDMAEKELLAYLVAHNLIRSSPKPSHVTRWIWNGSASKAASMPFASTATPSPKLATKGCAANSGRTCCLTSRAISSATAPTAKNLGRSNTGPNLTHYSINRAAASLKSPTAAATGKAAPAIIAPLTKGHSCQS
jgi:hypothetical protein